MKTVRTKWDLFRYLGGEHPLPVRLVDGSGNEHVGYLQAVECEDGSGHSFNVRIGRVGTQTGNESFHFRTTD